MKNVFNFLSFYFKIIHSSSSLFLVLTAVVFSSCTHSLNIMNRKYRPGYSIQYSTNTNHSSKKTTQAEQPQPEPRQDSVALKTMNDDVIVSSDNSELFLKEYNAPDYSMPCDTPPPKAAVEPFSLYKPVEPKDGHSAKWKPLEPYNVIGYLIFFTSILAGILTGPVFGPFFFFFLVFNVYILDIISLVKINKHPNKYAKSCKVSDKIFIFIISLILLIALILLVFVALTG